MARPTNWEQVWYTCRDNIEAFVNIFLSKAAYAKTPPFHNEIYSCLRDETLRKLAIVAPRGHSKSTVVSVAYPLWRICYNPPGEDWFLILISESQAQSINFLNIVKNNLEGNHLLRAYYGDLVGSKKWSGEEFITRNNCRVAAKGTLQKVRGMIMGENTITRPNAIILDDFESETNSATPEQIDKNIKWIVKAVEPSLADDGRLITIGTIIHERAYLNRVRKDPSFRSLFYQAIVDGDPKDLSTGRPLWPERFSMKTLLDKKASYESRGQMDAFWQEYMNIAVNLEDQTFREEWYKHFDDDFKIINGQPTIIKQDGTMIPVHTGMGVDLAISVEKAADFTVISILAADFEDNRYFLHYERLKTKNMQEILDKMFELGVKYGVLTINIETVQFQQVVAEEFRRQMAQRNQVFGVVETKPRTSKDSRIQSLQALFTSGRFYHRSWMMAFESELFAFPNAAHDDILDSVHLANTVTHPPEIESYKDSTSLMGGFDGYTLPYSEERSWMAL